MRRTDSADLTQSTVPALAGIAAAIVAGSATANGGGSELSEAARAVARRRDNVTGVLLRDLSRQEISVLEGNGCRAEDWGQVQVAEDFDCFRVRRVHVKGRCVLGRFSGEVEIVPGIRLPCGISDATLIDCQIGNDCLIENVRFAANLVVEREAVLFDVGSITCSGAALFGCGADICVGPETGGREVPVWDTCTIDQLAAIARERGDDEGQRAVQAAIAAWRQALRSPVAWVRRRARVLHTTKLRDVYVGIGAVVDHALEIDDAALIATPEEPVRVGGGASVRRSLLQSGVEVSGNGIVRDAALLEHSAVDEHASVASSVIGPNTRIAKGEVTASLIGPFVGFHHQSLLIAALWPEGKGNVAYGAMVGSNHTGRAPDQEIWPGEGAFFGLGCAVRFPCDFSAAPYTTVSMGVTMLPQRLTFPFSLVAVPIAPLDESLGVPRAYNELIPAWGLSANAYAQVRAELKFAHRDRARRHRIDYKVYRPQIMRLVRDARDRLKAVTVRRAVYLDRDLDGVGKNFLREEVRVQAIATYERALTRYALRLLLNEREGKLTIPGSAEIAHELADELLPATSFAQRMQRLLDLERENANEVQASKAKDDARGAAVIPGYGDAHLPARFDKVVKSAWERLQLTEERVARVL